MNELTREELDAWEKQIISNKTSAVTRRPSDEFILQLVAAARKGLDAVPDSFIRGMEEVHKMEKKELQTTIQARENLVSEKIQENVQLQQQLTSLKEQHVKDLEELRKGLLEQRERRQATEQQLSRRRAN